MDKLSRLAFNQLHQKIKRVNDYKLYYGANKMPWYGPDTYANCAAAKKRFIQSGQGYQKHFFKIK